jgi:hypothetical protein
MANEKLSNANNLPNNLHEQIETHPLERSATITCAGCGSDVDPASTEIPSKIINGVLVKGRAYCSTCRQVGALKENWQPQNGGRVSNMFVVK